MRSTSRHRRGAVRPTATSPSRGVARQRRRRQRAEPGTRQTTPLHERTWRQGALIVVMILVASGLSLRLVFWQLIDRGPLVAYATRQEAGGPAAPPARGIIVDSSGNPMALDDQLYQIWADPKQIYYPSQEAQTLAPILHLPYGNIYPYLTGSKGGYVQLPACVLPCSLEHEDVDQNKYTTLQNLNLAGINLQSVPNRVYPQGQLASQALGFVSTQGGQYGVEQSYDPLLSGKASPAELRRVGVWRQTGDRIITSRDPGNGQGIQTGATLHLSIDSYLQNLAEDALQKAIRRFRATGGSVIIMNPNTGRIIAIANRPDFNANSYAAAPVANFTDPAISTAYEPGSTFKILTMAAGIDTHVITPTTSFYDNGVAYYYGTAIHNWNYPVANGEETMVQVLQHSANVGASFVANRLGDQRFYRYIRRFGIGSQTGVDLAGESGGTLPLPGTKTWNQINLYTNSFGQAETITPLQLINAVDAVANGGCLMQPQIVTQIDYAGTRLYRRPQCIRRVISPQSAHTVTHMLVQSAIDGEASMALVHGYNIAAKTGTAQIPSNGGYETGPGSTIASTIAYAPANHPRVSVLVVVRKPYSVPWGSEVAAPVVSQLLRSLFLYYRIPPIGE